MVAILLFNTRIADSLSTHLVDTLKNIINPRKKFIKAEVRSTCLRSSHSSLWKPPTAHTVLFPCSVRVCVIEEKTVIKYQ